MKKNIMKRTFGLILPIVMVTAMVLIPNTALAATTHTLDTSSGTILLNDGDTVTGTGGTNTRLQIKDGATVTFSGVNLSGVDEIAVEVLGTATINLEDGTTNTIKSGSNKAGIQVEAGRSLTIQGSGTLNATGGNYGAGIGGGRDGASGTITILGNADVTATGGYDGAGIGGGRSGAGGTITISDNAEVTATGGSNGAGIGGGHNGAGGTIAILGNADVTASGGDYGAGIGGGSNGAGGIINISDNADITATGGENGAGIGGGYHGAGGTINISGSVDVTASGGNYGAGIGGGSNNLGGIITISGSADVTANGGGNGAGIGGGYLGHGGAITISGGTVNATGGLYGAGIGGGAGGMGGIVAISGGAKVYAEGRGLLGRGEDIGKGNEGYSSGDLTVSGLNTVVFLSCNLAFSGATLNDYLSFWTSGISERLNILNLNQSPWSGAQGVYSVPIVTVTSTLLGITTSGASNAFMADTYTATLSASAGYSLPNSISISMSVFDLDAGEDYTYNSNTGAVSIPNVCGYIVITANGVLNNYSVTSMLTNLTTNGAGSADHDSTYTATLSADTGYSLPNSISVTMGGTTLAAGTDYTYNSTSGALSIHNVSGDIVITASGAADTYTVTSMLTNLTTNGAGSADHDSTYTATLSADTGYSLPNSIAVTMGGTTLAAGTDYIYNSTSGALSIHNVSGAIVIAASGAADTTSPNPEPTPESTSEPRPRTISGTLIGDDDRPLAGYIITLYSSPEVCVTDNEGKYIFENVIYENHTLTIGNTSGEQVGSFTIDMSEGNAESVTIDNINKTANVIYKADTEKVILSLKLNADGSAIIQDITFGSDEYDDVPQTGMLSKDGGTNIWLWFILAAVAAGAIAYVVIRKRNIERA